MEIKKKINKKFNFGRAIFFNLLILLLLIFFTSCSMNSKDSNVNMKGFFFNKGDTSAESIHTSYPYGVISIPNLKDKNYLLKGEKFNLYYRIYNPSSYDMKSIQYKLSGFDKSFISEGNLNNIEGTLPDIKGKVSDRVNFKEITIGPLSFNNFEGIYNPEFVFKVCYSQTPFYGSKNYVIPKKNYYGKFPKMEFLDEGLPVKIIYKDGYKEDENGNIRFDFEVKNTGNGKVMQNCFDEEDIYSVELKILSFKVGNKDGECNDLYDENKNNIVELRNGEGAFTCVFNRNDNDDEYQTQVKIELSYVYQFETRKKITVKDPRKN